MNKSQRDYARDMRRRDREMRKQDMRRRNSRGQFMRDREMDGRNPYGSRGGCVVDRNIDYGRNGNGQEMRMGDYRQSNVRNDYGSRRFNDEMNNGDYERSREYYGVYGDTPFHIQGVENYYSDRNYDMRMRDYGETDRLSKDDLEDWCEDLMSELDQEEKEVFKMDRVIQKAKEMGVQFGKHFDEEEFYVLALALYDDYKKTIGKNSVEMTILLTKDWLHDKDSALKGGEKLAVYYDEIVTAD